MITSLLKRANLQYFGVISKITESMWHPYSWILNTNKYSLSSLRNNLLYLIRIDKCVWKLPKGEGSCEVGTEKQICSAESTIRYNGNVGNCSIKIDRVQPDENGIWTVRQHLNELSRCTSITSKYIFRCSA